MISITIENSTYCGADCLTCIRKKMKNVNQNMSDEFFYSIVDKINEWNDGSIEVISLVGTGDPLMDPGFVNKIKYVKDKTNLRIHLTNTGHMLSSDILDDVCKYVDSIKISHYGASPETYKIVHGGGVNFYDVLSNIERLLGRPDRPLVSMSFLMIDENFYEKDVWIKRWESKCDAVDVWIPHNWAGHYKNSQGKGQAGSCGRPGKDFMIHVDGKVSVCCLDVCEDLIVGDLSHETWSDIMESDELRRIKQLHQCGRYDQCGICGNCDLLYDRKDALIYTSNKNMTVGKKSGLIVNRVDFGEEDVKTDNF